MNEKEGENISENILRWEGREGWKEKVFQNKFRFAGDWNI